MQQTWRWFGPEDTVSLENVVQAGASGVVTSLAHIATGDAWPPGDIMRRKQLIESHGLNWAVVESIPVHNDIKTRSGNYQAHINNYKRTIRNLGNAGISVVCYNFMPVVDWTRTSLSYPLANASQSLRFEMADFVAYDVYILEREHAAKDYDDALLARAEQRISKMSTDETELLEKNIIAGLPGGEGSYSRDSIHAAIKEFITLGTEGLRQNLFAFLSDILPVAEASNVRLCIHPDDPPFSLFGLPRVVSTAEDVRKILSAHASPSNGLTLCAGSFGARADNNLVAMAREFGPNIYFAHLRNIKREPDGSFHESAHLDGDNDIVGLISALLDEEQRRRKEGRTDSIPMRPDHGHLFGEEVGNPLVRPGYSFAGRLKGLAELRGVLHTLTTIRSQEADANRSR